MELPSILVSGKDGDRRDGGGAADVVCQSNSCPLNLVFGVTAKLVEQFVALRHSGRARRVALGLETTTRIDRDRTADVVLPAFDQLVRLEAIGEAEVFVTDQLHTGETVVHF